MNTSSYKEYLVNCKKEIEKNRDMNLSYEKKEDLSLSIFRNFDKVKHLAHNIRYKFINNIDDNLIVFDKNFSENGGEVHWCVAYDDFIDKIFKLLDKKNIKKVNLFSSNFIDELGLKDSLKENEIKNDTESDDCIIFSPQEGIVNTGSLFLNFNSAYDMELVIGSKLKIFVLPINDFLFKLEDIEIFSHLYSIYKDEIDYPYLTSIYTPSPLEKENNVHLFLVDNGRSNILENKEIRQALTCINCGACKQVCPIYNIIGDKPYDNIFSGPIANVILPFIENIESYKHLCFNCTLCGNCSKICPVDIPISELIIANKHYFFENKFMDIKDNRLANNLGKILTSRNKMNAKRWIKIMKMKILLNNSNISNSYMFTKSTFNQQYRTDKNGYNQD